MFGRKKSQQIERKYAEAWEVRNEEILNLLNNYQFALIINDCLSDFSRYLIDIRFAKSIDEMPNEFYPDIQEPDWYESPSVNDLTKSAIKYVTKRCGQHVRKQFGKTPLSNEVEKLIKEKNQQIAEMRLTIAELQEKLRYQDKRFSQPNNAMSGVIKRSSSLREVARRNLLSSNTCSYCGITITDNRFHLDHVIPVSKGGPDSLGNLVKACEPCNLEKSDKTWLPLEGSLYADGTVETRRGGGKYSAWPTRVG